MASPTHIAERVSIPSSAEVVDGNSKGVTSILAIDSPDNRSTDSARWVADDLSPAQSVRTSRRALIMNSIVSAAALTSAVAVAESPALAVPAVAATEISGSDRELRRLWSEYLAIVPALEALEAEYAPARAAFDAEMPPCPVDVRMGDHFEANQWLWRKHGLDELSDKRHSIDTAIRETIAAILGTRAEGLFGLAVKLSALPVGEYEEAGYDLVEASALVLEDIDRLLGSNFGARFGEIYDPHYCNRDFEAEEDEDEEAQS
jgi:hypothetical protein